MSKWPLERLERVLDELDAVCATYPEPGAVRFSTREETIISSARDTLARRDSTQASKMSDISGEVRLLDCAPLEQPIGVQFSLQTDYPIARPSIKVVCASGESL